MLPLPVSASQVMDRLATLEEQLERSMKEKLRLESEVELCTQKLERAEKLITVGGWGAHHGGWGHCVGNAR